MWLNILKSRPLIIEQPVESDFYRDIIVIRRNQVKCIFLLIEYQGDI